MGCGDPTKRAAGFAEPVGALARIGLSKGLGGWLIDERTVMSMTQRYAGMLRRHAGEWDKQGMPVQAECARQAARHMEELQAAKDAIARPWQPMKTAPKDGTMVLVLLESSDVPKAVEWCEPDHFFASDGAGWYMTWDGTKIQPHDGPRYWMHCPDDPDDVGEPDDA